MDLEAKCWRIKLRIEGFLNVVVEDKKNIPRQLLFFFDNVFNNGIIMPQLYLTNYEKSRLQADQFNQLVGIHERRQRMLIAMFIFSRTLIQKNLLENNEASPEEIQESASESSRLSDGNELKSRWQLELERRDLAKQKVVEKQEALEKKAQEEELKKKEI